MPSESSASLEELADVWLTTKRSLESAEQVEKGNSDRARRADLDRWSSVLEEVVRGTPANGQSEPLMRSIRREDLTAEHLVAAVAKAKGRWSDATVARMLSTMRGWCRWLVRGGHLATDPMTDDFLQSPSRQAPRPRAISAADVDRLALEAAQAPPKGTRLYLPVRDVALVRFMAATGARTEEVCGARVGEIDRRAERPIWRVGRSKGGKRRDVPLGATTTATLDAWLAWRTTGPEGQTLGSPDPAAPLFIRTGGGALNPQALNRIVIGLGRRAGVVFPHGAAAHAFRHHFGETLALRGMPLTVISQLLGHADPRTTSIYTTVAAIQLIDAMDDAGLLT